LFNAITGTWFAPGRAPFDQTSKRTQRFRVVDSDPSEHDMATAVQVEVAGVKLNGDLELPANPLGIVLFAHGSGAAG
jgi:hypothetical protein